MKLIYIAGPYTPKEKDPILAELQTKNNIAAANACGKMVTQVTDCKCFPVIPHNNTPIGWENEAPGQYFINGTMLIMEACDAIFIIPGSKWKDSTGTLGEIARAEALGIPVFYKIEDLKNWINDYNN